MPLKGLPINIYMLKRDLCPLCQENLVAINYIRNGQHHYRNSCASCIRKKHRIRNPIPLWARSGYKKKENFTLKHFQERVRIYSEERFEFKLYNIDLKV